MIGGRIHAGDLAGGTISLKKRIAVTSRRMRPYGTKRGHANTFPFFPALFHFWLRIYDEFCKTPTASMK